MLGIVTVRLSGHYLPLGTIAWGIGLFYLFSKLEFLGRNDGISGIPPLSIGTFRMLEPGTIYFVIWIAVLISALLTMNLLDSRTGRAIRALRRGHIAGRSVRRADAARQAAGVHLCGGAGRPLRLALCAFPARRQPDAVRRAGRHRISLHRRGRRRRLCLGRGARRRHRRDPEGDAAELSAVYLRRPEPARDHRVRHPAGACCCSWRRPASGRG